MTSPPPPRPPAPCCAAPPPAGMHLTKARAPTLDCGERFEAEDEERGEEGLPLPSSPSVPAAAADGGAAPSPETTAGAHATDSTRGTNTRSWYGLVENDDEEGADPPFE